MGLSDQAVLVPMALVRVWNKGLAIFAVYPII